jgi:hypothetical protein
VALRFVRLELVNSKKQIQNLTSRRYSVNDIGERYICDKRKLRVTLIIRAFVSIEIVAP